MTVLPLNDAENQIQGFRVAVVAVLLLASGCQRTSEPSQPSHAPSTETSSVVASEPSEGRAMHNTGADSPASAYENVVDKTCGNTTFSVGIMTNGAGQKSSALILQGCIFRL